MFQDVVSLLGRFGLKDADAKVFLALLHFKEGLYVHELVRQTSIKRSSVDLILGRLISEGYAVRVLSGKRHKYFAKAPEQIFFQKEQALGDFREILPVLSRLGASKEETQVQFFEGAQGVRRIHEDILLRLKHAEESKKELLSFSSGQHLIKIFPEMQKAFINKRIKMGVWYKAIAPLSSKKIPEWTDSPQSLRAVRYIEEKKFNFEMQMEVYADSIMIYSPLKPVGGVVIHNARIASSMRSLFYLMWNMLP
jgi:sugar-specific transcriptional regulator TrmB